MLTLRPYKPCDADAIASWCKDERALRRWSSDRFGDFPVTGEDINEKYIGANGDCVEPDNFYPFTACDGGTPVGHLIMRFTGGNIKTLRFGLVIVDDTRRGKGYGKQMLELALRFAFEIFGADKVTLGVFDDNLPAWNCYKAAGFVDVETEEKETCTLCGEVWSILEMAMTREDYQKRG